MAGEHTVQNIKDKKYAIINCHSCANNASLGNSSCFECISNKISQLKNIDNLIFQKTYRKFLDENSFRILKEYLDALKKIPEGDELCDEDFEKNAVFKFRAREDPVTALKYLDETTFCDKDKEHLKKLKSIFSRTSLWKEVQKNIKLPEKEIYHVVFRDKIVPGFVSFHIEEVKDGKKIEGYGVGESEVSIMQIKGKPYPIYRVTPKEFNLSRKHLEILSHAFEKLSEADYDLQKGDSICRKAIDEFGNELKQDEKKFLTEILRRYSFGYGIIEVILKDPKVQDVYVDSPGNKPVYIYHEDYEECATNIILSPEEIDKLSTRFRMLSGRPFDESFPTLHSDIQELGVRVAGITEPMTFSGTGFAFRKHAVKPWTLQQFIANKMITPEAAGLLSFMLDGQQSMLITGPRGGGKTSFLGALLIEIPQNYRIITIEDTPELPVEKLRHLGFNIQHIKIKSTFQREAYEVTAEDALRNALRLGESVLILGEVRGEEAKSLFEAMRIGAAGNVVLGTIHGSSAYDVWDRIVNDLKVPSTSFKATKLIVSCAPIKKREELRRYRRVVGITEVLRYWKEDPHLEKGFVELMDYNRKTDKLSLSKSIRKSEAIKDIISKRGMSMSEAVKSIRTRAKVKEEIVKASAKNKELLGVRFSVMSVNKYLELVKSSKKTDYSKVLREFKKWLKVQQKEFK